MPSRPRNPASAYHFSVIREKLRRHQGPALDFALGRRRELPPEWLPAFVDEHARLAFSRRSDDDLEAFADAAVEMLGSLYGLSVAPEQVLVAPSGRAAMSALVTVCLEPGDTALVTEPSYPAFARLASQRKARLAVAALDPLRGFAPDLGGLGEGAVRIAALNYPNNPTGSVIAPPVLAALRARLGDGALVFNDATYGPLTYGRRAFSLLQPEFAAAAGEALELHSLGKSFAVGPLGVAFFVGPQALVAQIDEYGDFAWTQLSALQVRASAACLKDVDYLGRRRADFEARLTALGEVVRGLGLAPYPVGGGMHLLCPAPAAIGDRAVASAAEAAAALFELHALAVASFDVGQQGYLRFSSAFRPEDLDALAGLGRVVG